MTDKHQMKKNDNFQFNVFCNDADILKEMEQKKNVRELKVYDSLVTQADFDKF